MITNANLYPYVLGGQPLKVCYYTNWSQYRNKPVTFLPGKMHTFYICIVTMVATVVAHHICTANEYAENKVHEICHN